MIYYKKQNFFKKLKKLFLNVKDSLDFDIKPLNLAFRSGFKSLILLFSFLLIGFYLTYLFYLPKFCNEENIEKFLNNYLAKNTKFILDIDNFTVQPGYKFNLNLKADSVKLQYSPKRDFLVLNKADIDINLLTLFFKYLDLNKIKIDKVMINTNFTKNNKISCFECFSFDIFNLKNHKLMLELRNINVLANSVKINFYDENINKTFYINSNKTKLSILSLLTKDKLVTLSTDGTIKTNSKKISDYNLNFEYKLKEIALDKLDNKFKSFNYNPLVYAYDFDFYTKSNINLKVAPKLDKPENYNVNGKIEFTDLTFKYNNIKLPKNNFIVLFKGDKLTTDFSFNFLNNQFIKVKAMASMNKNKFIELNINSNEINLSELNSVLEPLAKILNLKIAQHKIKLKGVLLADLYLKSDFKKITSNGVLKIKNANITDVKKNISVDNINSDVSFKNNQINILNSSFELEKEKFYLTGSVLSNSKLDLKINSNSINLAKLSSILKLNPFLMSSMKDILITDGFIKVNAEILGTIEKPLFRINSSVTNLKAHLKNYNLDVLAPTVSISSYDNQTITLKPKNAVLSTFVNKKKYLIKLPNPILNASKDEILLAETKVFVDKIEGALKAKFKNNTLDFNLNSSKLNNNNLVIIKNSNTKLSLEASIKQNKILINNFKLFNHDGVIAEIKGTLDNLDKEINLNNLKINVDNKLSLSAPCYNNLSFDVTLARFLANGSINKPNLSGQINLKNIGYPLYQLKVNDVILNIKNSNAYFNILNAYLLDSNFDLTGNLKYQNDKITVQNVSVSANYLDMDKVLASLNKNTALKTNSNNFEVNKFNLAFQSVNLMNIVADNVNVIGSIKNNIVEVSRFSLSAFKGTLSGSLNYNLLTNQTKTDTILRDINIRLLTNSLQDLKDISIAATGKLNGLVSVAFKGGEFRDILKTSDGYIKFSINDGELAQFAKLERFLQAGNILSQSILKLSLNSIISTVTKQNTGDFQLIEGSVMVKNSNAEVKYIKTKGTNMSLYLTGRYNLLTQNANLKVLGRVPVNIVNVMGTFGSFSAQKLVDKMTDDTRTTVETITKSPFEKMFSDVIALSDLEKIPQLTNQGTRQTREFIVFIQGLIQNTGSIKNFRWNRHSE